MTQPSTVRREGRALAELLALTGVAVAQPVLDTVGRAQLELAAIGVEPRHLVLYAVAVAIVPALLLWAVELGAGLAGETVRRWTHRLLLGGLVGLVAVQLLAGEVPAGVVVLLATLAAAAGTAAAGVRGVRLWLSYLAFGPLVFLGLFLFASPASVLLESAGVGEPAPAVERPASVVVLVLDELPLATLLASDGTIDAELFPNFAALAAESHWFRNATATSNLTYYAAPPILTGRDVPDTGPIAARSPNNLFTLLAESHALRVSEVTNLCPASICGGTSDTDVLGRLFSTSFEILEHRLSLNDDDVTPLEDFGGRVGLEGPADLQREPVAEFLAGFDPEDDRPALTFFHPVFPHQPFQYLPDGTQYRLDGQSVPPLGGRLDFEHGDEDWTGQAWAAALGRQRHVLQVMWADQLLGAVRDRLLASGRYDDTVLTVVSDHGIGFLPDGPIRAVLGQEVTEELAPELLWVPFFVKAPGQRAGEVHDDNVLVADLLPTVAGLLGAELPYDVDGIDALATRRPDATKPFWTGQLHSDFTFTLTAEQEFDGAALFPEVLDRAIGHFLPDVGDPWRVWRIGPAPELVGRRLSELPPGALVPAAVTLRHPEDFTTVDPPSGVPALVIGDAPDLPVGTPIAVAVNGTIAATAPAYVVADHVVVAAMIDHRLLRPTGNRVEFFQISEPGG